MSSAQKSSSQKPKQTILNKKVIIFLVIIVGVLFLLWLLVRNNTLYTPQKSAIYSSMNDTLNNFPLSGDVIHQGISDKGCGETTPGVFSKVITCSYDGLKYYRSSLAPKDEYKNLAQYFKSQGWQAFGSSQNHPLDSLDLSADLSRLSYYRANDQGLYLSADQKGYPPLIAILNSLNYHTNLNDGDYIYKIEVIDAYWTCTQDSFFKLPCPTPPSQPTQ